MRPREAHLGAVVVPIHEAEAVVVAAVQAKAVAEGLIYISLSLILI